MVGVGTGLVGSGTVGDGVAAGTWALPHAAMLTAITSRTNNLFKRTSYQLNLLVVMEHFFTPSAFYPIYSRVLLPFSCPPAHSGRESCGKYRKFGIFHQSYASSHCMR